MTGTITTSGASITGSATVGSELTANAGTWSPVTPSTVTYQWKRGGSPISGATGSTYTLVPADAGAVITVTVGGSETNYTVTSSTSGGTAAVGDTQPNNFARNLAMNFWYRPATTAEVDYVAGSLANGTPRSTIVNGFAYSTEYVTSVVNGFYWNILQRPADPGGLTGWVNQIMAGMSPTTVAIAFYSSPEYYNGIGQGNNTAWVESLYTSMLGRTADPNGLAGWVSMLNSGASLSTVAGGIYNSPESCGVRVNALYLQFLNRTVDPAGLSTWSQYIASPGSIWVAAALAASDEYYAKPYVLPPL